MARPVNRGYDIQIDPLGVPRRGSNKATYGTMLADVAQSVSLAALPRGVQLPRAVTDVKSFESGVSMRDFLSTCND